MAKVLGKRALAPVGHIDGLSPEQAPDRRLYSVKEVAKLLSVRPNYVYTLAYSGRLKTVKLGRRRLVPSEEFEALLAELKAS